MAPKQRRRKGTVSDRLEGGCAACCAKYCRMTPMTQALCCTVVVLGITGAVVWLGGSIVGAGNGASSCDSQSPTTAASGESDFSPSLNIWLTNTGIVVMMMLITSCICCVGFVGLCCGELPTTARIVGGVCLIVAAVGALLYTGWIAYGTYAITKQPDCINALVYLMLMYFYLFVFVGASVVGVIWKLHDIRTGGKQSFKVNLPS